MTYRVAIVGAARRKQGTGPFVAKLFSSLGHQIVGIIGSTQASAAKTCQDLNSQFHINTEAFTDLTTLLKSQQVDIVAICSPPDTHLTYLEQALTHGTHVFCEKPLWWASDDALDQDQYQKKIESIIQLADNKQSYIHLNTQWPYTLSDFYKIHAMQIDAAAPIMQFSMRLSPASTGVEMIVDAASHGLSMLYQLVGQGEIKDIIFKTNDSTQATDLSIQFRYEHQKGSTEACFDLIHSDTNPKPASYQINNLQVDRTVLLPEYQIQLQSDSQTVAIKDPLLLSIEDFIASIEAKLTNDHVALKQGANDLFKLIHAYKQR